jgi:hypothetical protein
VVRYELPRPEGRGRKAVRRVTTTLAAIALILGIVVGLVPARAVPRERANHGRIDGFPVQRIQAAIGR